jgi:hypothetical protein
MRAHCIIEIDRNKCVVVLENGIKCDAIDAARASVYVIARTPTGEELLFCNECGLASFNPNDVINRYCGGCHSFLDPSLPHGTRPKLERPKAPPASPATSCDCPCCQVGGGGKLTISGGKVVLGGAAYDLADVPTVDSLLGLPGDTIQRAMDDVLSEQAEGWDKVRAAVRGLKHHTIHFGEILDLPGDAKRYVDGFLEAIEADANEVITAIDEHGLANEDAYSRIAPIEYVSPPGTGDLPLLAAIARRFDIESFPPGTAVHFDGGGEKYLPRFIITGPLRKVFGKDGRVYVDPAHADAREGDFFEMTIAITPGVAEELHRVSYEIGDEVNRREARWERTDQCVVDVHYPREPHPWPHVQEMHQGPFARDVQRQLKGPIA